MRVEPFGTHRLEGLSFVFVSLPELFGDLEDDYSTEDFDNALLWFSHIEEMSEKHIESDDNHRVSSECLQEAFCIKLEFHTISLIRHRR